MGIKGFLTTLGLGIGAMYFLDPDQGDRRRAQARDRVVGARREAQDVWQQGSEDLANRARRLGRRTGSATRGLAEGEWEPLTEPAEGGKLGLSMDRPGDRLIVMSGGGLLTLFGLTRRGLLGKLALLAGLNFVVQGLSRKNYLGGAIGRLRGSGMGAGIEFRKAIRIEAPVEEVFAFWQNYDNFPRFMSHLQEVRAQGGSGRGARSHWVAIGPGGAPVEWDAQITEMQPNRVIAWESLPGSEVYNAGRVRFESVDGATRVDIFMTYNPPGGVAGHAVAALFGADPKSALDDDLLKLKSLIEDGRSAGAAERYRPGSGMTTRRRRAAGGNDALDALPADVGGESSGDEGAGFSGAGADLPAERKPGSDLPGAGS